ncbi:MAG: glycogen branching enzyme [Myxococcales bacterium]|nr:glycogen branching enzyme [Myxococcales bacterium]
MKARFLAAACLIASVSTATASPRKEDLEARVAALETKLEGQGYTVMIEGPFVVIGDESPKRVRSRASFMRWVRDLIEKDFFAKQPAKVIEVWLFRNEKTYRKGAKKFFDDEPTTPYGYYSSEDDALVMNIGPGAGTLSHELIHPYIEANFPDSPAWFNEGLASLYEQPREKEGHMWGTTNWRLPGLQGMIRNKSIPSLKALISTTREGFYDASYDSYAYARFLCQYLQDHGKLRDFYATFVADGKDTTGQRALEAVLGQDLASFQPVFNRWAASLRR